MNKCPKCKITLHVNETVCPICHNVIELNKPDSIYPKILPKYRSFKLFMKIALLISTLGIIFSCSINYIVNKQLSWSILVILGIVSFWLTFLVSAKHERSFMKKLFVEIIAIIILSILWDKSTGFHKWSITYVLPFLCTSYTVTFLIIRIFTSKATKDHVLYTYLNSLIGFIPAHFIIYNSLNVLWPSYLSVFTSIFVICFLFLFNRKTLESEIERRLHI